ncbi:MAG: hypothetical protein HFE28_06000 [Clostridia bacterium]|jgi:hypothetical protein|nr:hypothetical protein [Clostridia bacterium]
MANINLLDFDLLRLFSVQDLIIIGSILLVAIALIIGNIVLVHFYKKHAERKLCTKQLQQRREELLSVLEGMKNGGAFTVADEEEKEDDLTEEDMYEDDEDDEDLEMGVISADDEESLAEAVASAEGANEFDRRVRIMKASDMSPAMREKFSLVGSEYDEKSYFVRYAYSFEAKLNRAEEKIQERYVALLNELALYRGVKIANSSKQQRIYKGRKTLGLIMFRGHTLCVALALNPADYKDTKYRGIDMSEKKRFKATPMVFKLTSSRKIEYAKYLLVQLADVHTLVMNENPEKQEVTFENLTDAELFENDKLKIYVLGEVPENVLQKIEAEEAAKAAAEAEAKKAERLAKKAEKAGAAEVKEEVAAAKPKRGRKSAE